MRKRGKQDSLPPPFARKTLRWSMQLVDTCRCDVTNKPRTFIQMNFLMRKVRQHGGRFYVSKHTITITAASKIRSFYDCFCCFVRIACHVWGHAQTQTATQQYPLTQQEHTKHGNFDRSPPPYIYYTPGHINPESLQMVES